jgi:anti-anti-sigma factor
MQSSIPSQQKGALAPMEIKLLGNEEGIHRLEVVGKLTRDGYKAGAVDPVVALCGEDIFKKPALLSLARSMYLDSTGIEWLLNYFKRFQAEGGKLIVHSATPATQQLLKLMRLDSILHLEPTESAALDRARKALS